MQQPDRVQMPVIGGPRDGEIMGVDRGTAAWNVYLPPQITFAFDSDYSDSLGDHIVTYSVRRAVGILPGRTDRQWFKVLVAPDVRDLGQRLSPAMVVAWAQGWAPPDRQSEFWPAGPAASERDRIVFTLVDMGPQ